MSTSTASVKSGDCAESGQRRDCSLRISISTRDFGQIEPRPNRLDSRCPGGQVSRPAGTRFPRRRVPAFPFPLPLPSRVLSRQNHPPHAGLHPTEAGGRRVASRESVSSAARAAVHRQRLRRADLRDRLVPAAQPDRRIVRRVDGRAARHVHGRHVHRQPVPLEVHLAQAASAPRLRDARSRDRGLRAARIVGAPIRRWVCTSRSRSTA